MKLKHFAFDFEESTITFRVPADFMKSHRWGAGEAEIDLSEICYNMDNTKIAPESAVTSTNKQSTPCHCYLCGSTRKVDSYFVCYKCANTK